MFVLWLVLSALTPFSNFPILDLSAVHGSGFTFLLGWESKGGWASWPWAREGLAPPFLSAPVPLPQCSRPWHHPLPNPGITLRVPAHPQTESRAAVGLLVLLCHQNWRKKKKGEKSHLSLFFTKRPCFGSRSIVSKLESIDESLWNCVFLF